MYVLIWFTLQFCTPLCLPLHITSPLYLFFFYVITCNRIKSIWKIYRRVDIIIMGCPIHCKQRDILCPLLWLSRQGKSRIITLVLSSQGSIGFGVVPTSTDRHILSGILPSIMPLDSVVPHIPSEYEWIFHSRPHII